MTDSKMAIAKGIAELECEDEIKQLLSALFNIELLSGNAEPPSKASYVKEIENRFQTWTQSLGVDE